MGEPERCCTQWVGHATGRNSVHGMLSDSKGAFNASPLWLIEQHLGDSQVSSTRMAKALVCSDLLGPLEGAFCHKTGPLPACI